MSYQRRWPTPLERLDEGHASPAALALHGGGAAGGGRFGGGEGFAALALRQLHLPCLYLDASLVGRLLTDCFSAVHFKLENLQQLLLVLLVLLAAGASSCRRMLLPDSPPSVLPLAGCGSCSSLLLVDPSAALLLPLKTREDAVHQCSRHVAQTGPKGWRMGRCSPHCSLSLHQLEARYAGAPAALAAPVSVTTVSIWV